MRLSSDSRQQPLPLALPDARWDRLEAIIAQANQSTEAPLARQEARVLVRARLYRALTSATRDALPLWTPATPILQATLARWRECAALAQLSRALRIQLDDNPQPVRGRLGAGAPASMSEREGLDERER